MRFVNVGTIYDPSGAAIYFDIELSNQTSYTPKNASLNGFVNGRFAQVNLACDESVTLRATLLRSCGAFSPPLPTSPLPESPLPVIYSGRRNGAAAPACLSVHDCMRHLAQNLVTIRV